MGNLFYSDFFPDPVRLNQFSQNEIETNKILILIQVSGKTYSQ